MPPGTAIATGSAGAAAGEHHRRVEPAAELDPFERRLAEPAALGGGDRAGGVEARAP